MNKLLEINTAQFSTVAKFCNAVVAATSFLMPLVLGDDADFGAAGVGDATE